LWGIGGLRSLRFAGDRGSSLPPLRGG
jgi:hypothetical protein